jgi:hypothetical protein
MYIVEMNFVDIYDFNLRIIFLCYIIKKKQYNIRK